MDERPVVVIERTAKKYKAIQLIGMGIMGLGAAGCVLGVMVDAKPLMVAGLVAACIGGAVVGVGGGLAWWHHG